jgi:hypothetical protein
MFQAYNISDYEATTRGSQVKASLGYTVSSWPAKTV